MSRLLPFLFLLALSSTAVGQEAWTLQKCISHAFQNNIQIKQSELGLEQTRVTKEQSLGAMLPNLNASATHGYNWGQTIDPFTNQFATERIRSNSFGIGTNLTIFNGFQLLNQYKQSNVEIQVQQANLEKMQNDIALNVANSFLNVLFQEEFLKIARRNVDATLQQVNRIQALVDVGAAPEGDLFDIQAQFEADKASEIGAQNNLILAYLSLRQLILIPEEQAEAFKIVAPEIGEVDQLNIPGSAGAAVSNALNSFPEIKSAEASLVSADLGLSSARGGTLPRLSASFNYGSGYSGAAVVPVGELVPGGSVPIGFVEETGDLVVTQDFAYSGGFETKEFDAQIRDNVNQSLFFSLTVPIFNGFSNKANIERAKINQRNAYYSLELTKQQLRQNVESAYADALAANNNFQAARQSVTAAERAMEYAEARYEEGASNAIDYATARIRLDNARADFIRNKYDYLFRVKVVEFYMGQPLTLR